MLRILNKINRWFKNRSEKNDEVIITLDKNGKILSVSPKVVLLGYEPEDMLGTSFLKYLEGNFSDEISQGILKDALERFDDIEKEFIGKDGESYILGFSILPISEFGETKGYKIILRKLDDDIQKPENLKRTIDELNESEIRLRALFEMAPDGICITNLRGQYIDVNKAFCELTGKSKDELIGKHFLKTGILRPGDAWQNLKLFSQVVKGGLSKPILFKYLHKDGTEHYAEGHVSIVKIGRFKRELIAIERDVTERKKRDIELQETMKALELSNQELDDYTYAVSHDLKAPLRTIEAFSGFLLEDYSENLDDMGKDYLKRMGEASMRMKELIDDLLLISRVGRKFTELESIDLNELLSNIIQDLKAQLDELGAEIIIGDLPIIKTQSVWVKQLFSNLISNGLKFNRSPKPRIEICCESKENEYVFSVRDNGIGIRKKDQEKIFKIFQRLHTQEEFPGTGAGLTICKKIVESFGGKIWIDSKVGVGSTFYFTYPKESEENSEISDQISFEHDYPYLQNGLERVIPDQPTDQE